MMFDKPINHSFHHSRHIGHIEFSIVTYVPTVVNYLAVSRYLITNLISDQL
jgi:hypothetical protein